MAADLKAFIDQERQERDMKTDKAVKLNTEAMDHADNIKDAQDKLATIKQFVTTKEV